MAGDRIGRKESRDANSRDLVIGQRSQALVFQAVSEAHQSLEPEALLLRSELDGVSGSIFDFLYYFACVIEEHKLKPWGRKGSKYLLSAINALTKHRNFQHWILCEKCQTEFMPMHDDRVLSPFLAYHRGQLDWSALARCENCGGLVCERVSTDNS